MVTHSVSHRHRKAVREHSQPLLWSVAVISFALGAAATTLTIWQLSRLYTATVAPVITVEGTVQAQYEYKTANEPSPNPTGYFVNTPGIGRVYLTGKPLNEYVGKPVKALGSVSGICGPKSVPCYPLIKVREVAIPVEE